MNVICIWYLQRPEKSVGSPEAGVTGGNRANRLTGAGTKAGVLGKRNRHSEPLSRLSGYPHTCLCVCLLLFKDLFVYYLFYVYGCYPCVPHACQIPTETKNRVLDPLDLHLQRVVCHHVDAGNRI